jgi:hypothetical protein
MSLNYANVNTNANTNVCQVMNCQYKTEHVSKRHCCGTCKHNGHGKLECSNEDLIYELARFNGDIIKKSCKIKGCIDPQTHTSSGHSCLYCDKRSNNHMKHCPLSNHMKMNINMNETGDNSICDNIEDFSEDIRPNLTKTEINKISIGEYTDVYAGMGCTWFIRNNNGNIEYLFMHSDSWGQYGDDSSHLPRYKAFIYGFHKVK